MKEKEKKKENMESKKCMDKPCLNQMGNGLEKHLEDKPKKKAMIISHADLMLFQTQLESLERLIIDGFERIAKESSMNEVNKGFWPKVKLKLERIWPEAAAYALLGLVGIIYFWFLYIIWTEVLTPWLDNSLVHQQQSPTTAETVEPAAKLVEKPSFKPSERSERWVSQCIYNENKNRHLQYGIPNTVTPTNTATNIPPKENSAIPPEGNSAGIAALVMIGYIMASRIYKERASKGMDDFHAQSPF